MPALKAERVSRRLSVRLIEKNPFANPALVRSFVPDWAWCVLRVVGLILTGAIIWLLITEPDVGVAVFWLIAIPGLPLLFVVAPGLWRNVCPMAFLNQLPTLTGLTFNKPLPRLARENAYLVAVVLFLSLIFLRHPLLNQSAYAVAMMVGSALVLALLGGIVFSRKSGWCGTFCPLSPLEKTYGQAPVLLVPNRYCSLCNTCQKNCYDINPNTTIFKELADDSAWYVGHRKLFIGILPGFIYWFFTTADPGQSGYGPYFTGMAQSVVLSLGLFHLIAYLTPLRITYVVQLFAFAAILIFYWFGAPAVHTGLSKLFAVDIPAWTVTALQVIVLLAVSIAWVRSLAHERAYQRRTLVTDQSTGKTFSIVKGQPLLEATEAAEIPVTTITDLCRSGHCGRDPVVIVKGGENVKPPQDDELATLRRLGLEGKARLACSCHVNGPITIDMRARLAVKTAVPGAEQSKDT